VTDLATLVGQQLMFGLPGPALREEDVRLFRETRAGGLILYRRNFESPTQLRTLVADLESALGRRLLVATDHEGGRVIMLGRGVTIFPDSLAVGMAGEEAFAYRQGLVEARELRRLGVDLNFAPVLDVLTERYSPNIGIRSYGKDPRLVARYGTARIRGMGAGGLSACAKHFPGLGAVPRDPHRTLPTISLDWPTIDRAHLAPFRHAIEAGVATVMSSHVCYPAAGDPPGLPATCSPRLIRGLLRERMGFFGAILTDDLAMGALRAVGTIGEAAVQAASAGHDLFLVCADLEAARAVFTALCSAYRENRLRDEELHQVQLLVT